MCAFFSDVHAVVCVGRTPGGCGVWWPVLACLMPSSSPKVLRNPELVFTWITWSAQLTHFAICRWCYRWLVSISLCCWMEGRKAAGERLLSKWDPEGPGGGSVSHRSQLWKRCGWVT